MRENIRMKLTSPNQRRPARPGADDRLEQLRRTRARTGGLRAGRRIRQQPSRRNSTRPGKIHGHQKEQERRQCRTLSFRDIPTIRNWPSRSLRPRRRAPAPGRSGPKAPERRRTILNSRQKRPRPSPGPGHTALPRPPPRRRPSPRRPPRPLRTPRRISAPPQPQTSPPPPPTPWSRATPSEKSPNNIP
jgi:hypothetical protein